MFKWLKRIFIFWCILTVSYIAYKEINRFVDWCIEGEEAVQRAEERLNDR